MIYPKIRSASHDKLPNDYSYAKLDAFSDFFIKAPDGVFLVKLRKAGKTLSK